MQLVLPKIGVSSRATHWSPILLLSVDWQTRTRWGRWLSFLLGKELGTLLAFISLQDLTPVATMERLILARVALRLTQKLALGAPLNRR